MKVGCFGNDSVRHFEILFGSFQSISGVFERVFSLARHISHVRSVALDSIGESVGLAIDAVDGDAVKVDVVGNVVAVRLEYFYEKFELLLTYVSEVVLNHVNEMLRLFKELVDVVSVSFRLLLRRVD